VGGDYGWDFDAGTGRTAGGVEMISPSQIRAARALIGVKQSDLAKASGISLATLNNIERGIGDPRASTLDAIEQALHGAGVDMTTDPLTETVTLSVLSRPKAYETLYASQKILEILSDNSLTKVEEVLFFARHSDSDGEEGDIKICLLIEAINRHVLFDRVNFSLENGSRVAEIAGIMMAAFAYHRTGLFCIKAPIEDTTPADDLDALDRVRGEEWHPLDHPADFFDGFSNWEDLLHRYGSREGHPLKDLALLINKFELG
jgi:transcriptional regulator with XRE-family HTH domain